MDCELDRNLIEAPAQAQSDDGRDGEGVKWTSLRGMSHGLCLGCEREGRSEASRRESVNGMRKVERHCLRQCEQVPAISITGVPDAKPAARHDALSASATAAPGASPTAPQCSQIRNTIGSLLA